MQTLDRLKRQPIVLDENTHKYYHRPTKQVMKYSVTGLLWALKSQAEKDAIERTRADWEFKGKDVHALLADYLADKDLVYWPEHEPYVTPLLNHKFIQEFQPLASEYLMCDPSISLGGSFDALGIWREKLVLFDLKTQSKKNKYRTEAQLGGYLYLLKKTTGIVPDEVRTVWCRPGKTEVVPNQGTIACSHAWTEAWNRFQSEHSFT
tara:strand:- start:966 stop:1586 length:621 start_codon:yes stop_codon:yes gene_type:complete